MTPILAATLDTVGRVDAARIGETIKAEREKLGLSQGDLGARMKPKRHQVSVGEYEAGKSRFNLALLEQIADGLGIGLGVLLLRAGAIDPDLPVRELIATDRRLSAPARRLALQAYDLAVEGGELARRELPAE